MMGATETALKSTKALKTQENSVRRVERFKRYKTKGVRVGVSNTALVW